MSKEEMKEKDVKVVEEVKVEEKTKGNKEDVVKINLKQFFWVMFIFIFVIAVIFVIALTADVKRNGTNSDTKDTVQTSTIQDKE